MTTRFNGNTFDDWIIHFNLTKYKGYLTSSVGIVKLMDLKGVYEDVQLLEPIKKQMDLLSFKRFRDAGSLTTFASSTPSPPQTSTPPTPKIKTKTLKKVDSEVIGVSKVESGWECNVCMVDYSSKIYIFLAPCCGQSVCGTCAPSLSNCPYCRKKLPSILPRNIGLEDLIKSKSETTSTSISSVVRDAKPSDSTKHSKSLKPSKPGKEETNCTDKCIAPPPCESPFLCTICSVDCPNEFSYNQHLAGVKHLKKVNEDREAECEYKLETSPPTPHHLAPCRFGTGCTNSTAGHLTQYTHPMPCRFGTGCTNSTAEHLTQYTHPPPCRFGAGCTNSTAEHLSKYTHTSPCRFGAGCTNSTAEHLSKYTHPPPCRFGAGCTNSTAEHLTQYTHPPPCRFGAGCTNSTAEHLSKYTHPPPCRFGAGCTNNTAEHLSKYTHLSHGKAFKKVARSPWESIKITGHWSMLVVGGTGAGKSTFVNTFASFFFKGRFDAPKVVIPTHHHRVPETGFADSSETDVMRGDASQTTACGKYRFSNPDSSATTVTLVDTPGLCDTRGRAQDDLNLDMILNTFRDRTLPPLKAIVLVLNGQESRFKTDLKYCMAKLRGVIPDVLFQNIIVVFTHCPTEGSCLFERGRGFRTLLGVDVPSENVFYFENSAFVLSPAQLRENERDRNRIHTDWEGSMGMVDRLLDRVSQLGAVSHGVFIRVQENRDILKATLHGVRLKLRGMQATHDQLDKMDALMKAGKLDQAKFQNYTQKTIIPPTIELVDTNYHSTLCSSCNHVCHDHCGLSPISEPGSHQFTSCAAFRGTDCTACPKRCDFSTHYHAMKAMRTVPGRTVESVMSDIKTKYDKAVNTLNTAQLALTDIDKAKKSVEASIKKEIQKLHKVCLAIMEDCSAFNLAAELSAVIQQIEAEKSFMTNLKAHAEATEFINTIRTIIDGLSEQACGGARGGGGGGGAERSFHL